MKIFGGSPGKWATVRGLHWFYKRMPQTGYLTSTQQVQIIEWRSFWIRNSGKHRHMSVKQIIGGFIKRNVNEGLCSQIKLRFHHNSRNALKSLTISFKFISWKYCCWTICKLQVIIIKFKIDEFQVSGSCTLAHSDITIITTKISLALFNYYWIINFFCFY